MESTEIFLVLSERVRREIVHAVHDRELSVTEIVERVGASQPTVSKHLRVLREAGLVRMRAAGQRRFYQLEARGLAPVLVWLGSVGALPPGSHAKPAKPARAGYWAPKPEHQGDEPDSAHLQLGRSMGRAATRAADLLSNLPKFGRRRSPGS